MIIWVTGVLRRTGDWRLKWRTLVSEEGYRADCQNVGHLHWTVHSPCQDSSHPDDHFQSRYVTPRFKPFLKIIIVAVVFLFRGFLKADKCVGQVQIKLSAFDNKCEIHECFDVSVSIQMAF